MLVAIDRLQGAMDELGRPGDALEERAAAATAIEAMLDHQANVRSALDEVDPVARLAKLQNPPAVVTFESAAAAWEASLVGVTEGSRQAYRCRVLVAGVRCSAAGVAHGRRRAGGDRGSGRLAGATLRAYRVALRGILDRAGVEPNPARSARLRWPKIEAEQVNPMEAAELVAIRERVSKRLRLPLVVAEQCGERIGELVRLTWGDVDEQGSRFRLRRETTKGNRPRWVPCPRWLMQVLADTCPREDRTPERRVFIGFNDSTARGALRQACKLAGLAHYSPHDLRHRRVSL